MAKGFIAKYPGTCDECEKRFRKGTHVMFNGNDKIVHAGDCEDYDDEPPTLADEEAEYDSRTYGPNPDELGVKPTGVCARCFTVHAGECV